MTFVEFRRELNLKYGLHKPWPKKMFVDAHTYDELILQYIKAGAPLPKDSSEVLRFKGINIIKDDSLTSPEFPEE